MLEEESDEEMREMLKEELNDAKKISKNWNISSKILLLPKDPNDEEERYRRDTCRSRRG